MRREEYLAWFEELVGRYSTLPTHKSAAGLPYASGMNRTYYDRLNPVELREWVTEAGAALAAVFPVGHPSRADWDKILAQTGMHAIPEAAPFLLGVFRGATNLIRGGRLTSLVDSIRGDAEGELLDQADALLQGYRVAAAVIAGGALETHLRRLVSKNSLPINGAGSIEKYDGAIAQARNAGNEIYSANLGKLVKAWGGMRNDAAHDPGGFKWTEEDVRRMIEGVRDFIERTTGR
jgi:hypothetical protein